MKMQEFKIFSKFQFEMVQIRKIIRVNTSNSQRLSGANQVDGLPPVWHNTGAGLIVFDLDSDFLWKNATLNQNPISITIYFEKIDKIKMNIFI